MDNLDKLESLKNKLESLKNSFDLSISEPIETSVKEYNTYLSFQLDNECFAWPVIHLTEVLINQRIILIPASVKTIYGVINYKNQVIPVMNLHQALGIKHKKPGEQNIILVTKGVSFQFAFSVDALKNILSLEIDDIKSKPLSLNPEI